MGSYPAADEAAYELSKLFARFMEESTNEEIDTMLDAYRRHCARRGTGSKIPGVRTIRINEENCPDAVRSCAGAAGG